MEQAAPGVRPRRGWGTGLSSPRAVFWAAFALVALMSTLWAVASPLFSVPDENAHVAKAVAQSRGEVIGEAVEGRKHLVVDLPEGYDYNHGMMCYLFIPEHSAECGVDFGDGTGEQDFETWVATYNPIYYAVVGWPSLLTDDGIVAVYAMRILSALLCSLLLAWAFQLALAGSRARWMPFGAAFLALPMVVYFAGAVNPNGVEIAAGAALWLGVLRLLESFGTADDPHARPRWYLWLVVTISASLLVNARAIGPLWVLVIAVACSAVVGWRSAGRLFATRGSYPWLVAIAAASVFSLAWTLGTGGIASQADTADAPLVGASPLVGVAVMIRHTGDWVQQVLGVFGWLDTPLPFEAYLLVAVALGVLVVLAAAGSDRRGAIVVIGSLALALLLPALIQGFQISRTGLIWQGRYGLILYLAVPIAAAWALSRGSGDRLAFLSSRLTWIGVSLLAAFSSIAYVWVMRRYTQGLTTARSDEFPSSPWQPPIDDIALCVLYVVVALGFAVWIGRLGMLAARGVEASRADG